MVKYVKKYPNDYRNYASIVEKVFPSCIITDAISSDGTGAGYIEFEHQGNLYTTFVTVRDVQDEVGKLTVWVVDEQDKKYGKFEDMVAPSTMNYHIEETLRSASLNF